MWIRIVLWTVKQRWWISTGRNSGDEKKRYCDRGTNTRRITGNTTEYQEQ